MSRALLILSMSLLLAPTVRAQEAPIDISTMKENAICRGGAIDPAQTGRDLVSEAYKSGVTEAGLPFTIGPDREAPIGVDPGSFEVCLPFAQTIAAPVDGLRELPPMTYSMGYCTTVAAEDCVKGLYASLGIDTYGSIYFPTRVAPWTTAASTPSQQEQVDTLFGKYPLTINGTGVNSQIEVGDEDTLRPIGEPSAPIRPATPETAKGVVYAIPKPVAVNLQVEDAIENDTQLLIYILAKKGTEANFYTDDAILAFDLSAPTLLTGNTQIAAFWKSAGMTGVTFASTQYIGVPATGASSAPMILQISMVSGTLAAHQFAGKRIALWAINSKPKIVREWWTSKVQPRF